MKKITVIFLSLLLILSGLPAAVLATEAEPSLSVTAGCHSLDATNALLGTEELVENCKAAILYEINTETLLYAQNADERQFPSSIVKILTALIAINRVELNDMVTVKQEVLDAVPVSALRVELVAGEQLTVEQLLYSMMVGSGNDAAAVLADYAAGSQEDFVRIMNDYAKEIGCTDTNFVNVTGLHDESQYTTARDTARILADALKNEEFAKIFSTVEYTVPSTELSPTRYFLTSNHMTHKKEYEIYYDERVKGGRTGVTEIGERNIAVWAESGDMQVVSVILGAASQIAADGYSISRFGGFWETMNLLDDGLEGYGARQILYKNQALRQYNVLGGDSNVTVGPEVNVSSVLPGSVKMEDLEFRYSGEVAEYKAPIEKGDKLSSVQIWYGGVCLAEADLYALSGVRTAPDITVTAFHGSHGGAGGWILAILLILVIACGLYLGYRYVVLRKARKRTNRRRKGTH